MTDYSDLCEAIIRPVKHKPCPFCGGEPAIVDRVKGFEKTDSEPATDSFTVIACTTCGCEVFGNEDWNNAWKKWDTRKEVLHE